MKEFFVQNRVKLQELSRDLEEIATCSHLHDRSEFAEQKVDYFLTRIDKAFLFELADKLKETPSSPTTDEL